MQFGLYKGKGLYLGDANVLVMKVRDDIVWYISEFDNKEVWMTKERFLSRYEPYEV